jgi:hypothetical protein
LKECPEERPTNLVIVSALKSLLKVMFVLVVAASIAGVVMLVKRPKNEQPVSFDEWPDVPRNPDAD